MDARSFMMWYNIALATFWLLIAFGAMGTRRDAAEAFHVARHTADDAQLVGKPVYTQLKLARLTKATSFGIAALSVAAAVVRYVQPHQWSTLVVGLLQGTLATYYLVQLARFRRLSKQ